MEMNDLSFQEFSHLSKGTSDFTKNEAQLRRHYSQEPLFMQSRVISFFYD